MRAELGMAALCIVSAVIGVRLIEARNVESGAPAVAAASRIEPAPKAASPYRAGWRREIVIAAGADRQFHVSAAVNRRPTNFLIDTGAAFVALRETDARRANIYTMPADYTAPVSTANGVTKAARVRIDEIEIEGLVVRDVDAFILPDEKLGMNLLGMSFLSAISSVEARGGEMILRG